MGGKANNLRARLKALLEEHEADARVLTWSPRALLEALGVEPIRAELRAEVALESAVDDLEELEIDLDLGAPDEDGDETTTEPGMQGLSSAELRASIGGVEILRELGTGPLGRVLLGRDPDLRREVVVEILRDTSDLHVLERFLREQLVSALLDHPGVVPVYRLGVERDGVLYAIRARRHAQTLRERIQDGTSTRGLLRMLADAAWAVGAAHARGILHRSLSPECIFVGEDSGVFVADWRVATAKGADSEHHERDLIGAGVLCSTPDGTPIGTPGYMSPEQLGGHLDLIDARSDVWSLGVILFEILTGSPAIPGDAVADRCHQTLQGLPEDPRVRAPERLIHDTLAELCLSSCAFERDWRFESATAFARALQGWLDAPIPDRLRGRLDTEASAETSPELDEPSAAFQSEFMQAHEIWAQYEALSRELEPLQVEVQKLREVQMPWASPNHKRPLKHALRRLGRIEQERTRLLGQYVSVCERAHLIDPDHDGIRQALAGAYWSRFEEAEGRRDHKEMSFLRERIVAHDDAHQSYTQSLSSQGALSVYTDIAGAWVVCQRYDQSGPFWNLSEGDVLGETPIENVPLDHGSYLLTVRQQGMGDVRYPLTIQRGELAAHRVRMLPASSIPEGFVYIPGGAFLAGGDRSGRLRAPQRLMEMPGFLIARYPVTFDAYIVFLEELLRLNPSLAVNRAPRTGPESLLVDRKRLNFFPSPDLIDASARKLYPRDKGHEGRLPVSSISVEDALAYIAWRQERDGWLYRLPRTHEWEKAARGVDGRIFPWGDTFDAAFCKTRASRDLAPFSEPVGAFATDESVYGVHDMAGSIQEWCRDDAWRRAYRDDPGYTRGALPGERPPYACAIRGGAWSLYEGPCAAANHRLAPSRICARDIGFRLALSIGDDDEPVPIEPLD